MKFKSSTKGAIIQKSHSIHGILECLLACVGVFSLYMSIILFSFSPFDSSWLQTSGYTQPYNMGGQVGSCLSDTLFFALGIVAYLLSPIILIFSWKTLMHYNQHNHIDLFDLSLRIVGSLILLLTSCAMLELNIDDLYYFSSGGVVGKFLNNVIFFRLNHIYANFLLLFLWSIGIVLFTGCSWFFILKK